jgi:hypothetical protein
MFMLLHLGLKVPSRKGDFLWVPSRGEYSLANRYTDFLVNEIILDGTPIHLDSYQVPKPVHSQKAEVVAGKDSEAQESSDKSIQPQEAVQQARVDQEAYQVQDVAPSFKEKPLEEQAEVVPANDSPRKELDTKPQPQEAEKDAKATEAEGDPGASGWRQYAEKHPAFTVNLPLLWLILSC